MNENKIISILNLKVSDEDQPESRIDLEVTTTLQEGFLVTKIENYNREQVIIKDPIKDIRKDNTQKSINEDELRSFSFDQHIQKVKNNLHEIDKQMTIEEVEELMSEYKNKLVEKMLVEIYELKIEKTQGGN